MNKFISYFSLIMATAVVQTAVVSLHAQEVAAKDRFSIGVFWPPVWEHTNDLQYRWLGESNIDFVENVKNANLFTEAQNLEMLTLAHRYGFRVSVADPRIFGDDNAIREAVAAYQHHPALEGYYIKDEPDSTELDWAATIYRKLVQLDKGRVPHVNLYPNFVIPDYEQGYLSDWVQAVGPERLRFLTFDQYPFMVHGYLRPTYFENLEIVRRVGLKFGVRTAAYLQSVGIHDAYKRPSEGELRFNAYSALAYGVKRLIWFTYWTPAKGGKEAFTDAIIDREGRKTDLYEPFSRLNADLKPMGQYLFNRDVEEVYHVGSESPSGTRPLPKQYAIAPLDDSEDLLISKFSDPENEVVFMVVNKSLTVEKNIIFSVDAAYDSGEMLWTRSGKLKRKRLEVPSTGRFNMDLKAGEAKVVVLKRKK